MLNLRVLECCKGASGLMEIPSQPSEPLVAAVETAEQTALETSAGPEPSVDSRADDRIATEGPGALYILFCHYIYVDIIIMLHHVV